MLQVIKVSKIKEKKQVCWAFYFECCSMNANLIQGMLWILRAARGSRGKRTSGARWAISGHHTHSHTLTEVAKITLAFSPGNLLLQYFQSYLQPTLGLCHLLR